MNGNFTKMYKISIKGMWLRALEKNPDCDPCHSKSWALVQEGVESTISLLKTPFKCPRSEDTLPDLS